MLGVGLNLWLASRGGASLSAQVEALLAGTTGFALDPSDTSTLWQLSTRTTPVTAASDPIGAIDSKWGTTLRTFLQATAASRPIWNGVAGIDFDGTDDRLAIGSSNLLQNVPAAFACYKINADAVGSYPFSVGANASTAQRFAMAVSTGGTQLLVARTLDGTAETVITSGSLPITVGVSAVISGQVAYATDSTMIGRKDGTQNLSGLVAGVPSNTSNTASYAASIGSTAHNSLRYNGRLGRLVCLPFLPSADERALIEAWVGESAL